MYSGLFLRKCAPMKLQAVSLFVKPKQWLSQCGKVGAVPEWFDTASTSLKIGEYVMGFNSAIWRTKENCLTWSNRPKRAEEKKRDNPFTSSGKYSDLCVFVVSFYLLRVPVCDCGSCCSSDQQLRSASSVGARLHEKVAN